MINPNNEIVQTVIKTMLESSDYFFFAMDAATGAVTAFRSEIGESMLQNIAIHWERIEASNTTEMDYRRACRSFAQNPDPPSLLMEWVCRENIDFLDLSKDCLDMMPSYLPRIDMAHGIGVDGSRAMLATGQLGWESGTLAVL